MLLGEPRRLKLRQSGEVSKVRIVRLSEVKGVVLLDRNIGRGFEPAVTNMPIVENSRLQTGDGVAEVEFEDSSSLRLAPHSLVVFPQLGASCRRHDGLFSGTGEGDALCEPVEDSWQ